MLARLLTCAATSRALPYYGLLLRSPRYEELLSDRIASQGMECFLEVLRYIFFCRGDDEVFPRSNPSSSRNDGSHCRAADPQTTSSCRPYTVSTLFPITQPSSPSPSPPSPPKEPSCLSPSPPTDARVRHQLLPSASLSPSFCQSPSTADPHRLELHIASKTVAVQVDVPDVLSRNEDPRDSRPCVVDFPLHCSKISPASTPPSSPLSPLDSGGTTQETPKFKPKHMHSERYEIPEDLKERKHTKISPAATPPSSPHNPPESGGRIPETRKCKPKRTLTEKYEIPDDLEEQIKRDCMPAVLQNPLSPVNYAEYFGTLLYAEDYETEKWSDYLLHDVTLSLRAKEELVSLNSVQHKKKNQHQNDERFFVAFEIDAIPVRRPFLLSRDFVFLRTAGQKTTEPVKGVIVRVIESKTLLVEFGRDFHRQHSSTKKYDVSFSFNRVCLKRSHVAVSAAADPLLCKILFPHPEANATTYSSIQLYPTTVSSSQVINQILKLKGLVPYLIEGPLVDDLTATWHIVREAIVQIYRASCSCRILVCAPRNWTLDALMKRLMNEIPEKKLFRANAAFRDMDLVPDGILPTCLFEGECFTWPPLGVLLQFNVVTSTFMSSFKLHSAGIKADHFTHIFLLDASSSIEPETVVALANLVSKDTRIIVTGSLRDSPRWVRSGIGRRKDGLLRSFFHRLLEREPYCSGNPVCISRIVMEGCPW